MLERPLRSTSALMKNPSIIGLIIPMHHTVAFTVERTHWQSAGQATFHFSLEPNLLYFQGHFPQMPILPAVAQLKLLMDCVHELEPQLQFVGAPAMKFTHVLRPHDQVRLELKRVGTKLSFTYYVLHAHHEIMASSGHITLEQACGQDGS